MITFTNKKYGRIMDQLTTARKLVQEIRSGMWDVYLVEQAHEVLGELATAIEDGTIEVQE